MISQRTQTVLLLAVLALIGGAIALMVRFVNPDPPNPAPTTQSELDSGSQLPSGRLLFQPGPDATIMRLWTGSCHGGGTPLLELSDDGGFFFRSIRIPQIDDGTGVSAASPAISAIVALEPKARHDFVLWGADRDCTVRSYVTDDAGASWRQGNLPITAWWVDPKTGIVFSPQGPANITCDGISTLNGFDADRAVATCLDRSVHISDDGESWESAPDLDDSTTAVVFTSTRRGFSLREESDCSSRLYATVDGGETWSAGGCVLEDLAFPAMGATARMLIAGGSGPAWISKDGGDTWKRPINPQVDPEVLGRRLTPDTDEPNGEPTDEPTEEPTDEPSDGESTDDEE